MVQQVPSLNEASQFLTVGVWVGSARHQWEEKKSPTWAEKECVAYVRGDRAVKKKKMNIISLLVVMTK
jgi:hypothetical protein